MRYLLILTIQFTFLATLIAIPEAQAQRYHKIDTEVSEALKREFKAQYGYDWDHASDKVQQKFYALYNIRVKKERIQDRRRERMEQQKERREAQIRQMERRRLAVKKRQREIAKMKEARAKQLENRDFQQKMTMQMRKLKELRKKSEQR